MTKNVYLSLCQAPKIRYGTCTRTNNEFLELCKYFLNFNTDRLGSVWLAYLCNCGMYIPGPDFQVIKVGGLVKNGLGCFQNITCHLNRV